MKKTTHTIISSDSIGEIRIKNDEHREYVVMGAVFDRQLDFARSLMDVVSPHKKQCPGRALTVKTILYEIREVASEGYPAGIYWLAHFVRVLVEDWETANTLREIAADRGSYQAQLEEAETIFVMLELGFDEKYCVICLERALACISNDDSRCDQESRVKAKEIICSLYSDYFLCEHPESTSNSDISELHKQCLPIVMEFSSDPWAERAENMMKTLG